MQKLAAVGAHAAARFPGLRRPLQLAYQRHFAGIQGPHVRLFSGIYPDFKSALKAIPPARSGGYDNPASARRCEQDLFRVYPMDYPVIFWLSRVLPDARLLFDWGGNIGISYFAFRHLLHYPANLSWLVNDVPAVLEEGKKAAKQFGARGLHFTGSMAPLSGADILLAAGSLHFIEDPFDILRKQSALPPHLLINKVPVYSMPSAVTVQNMGTALLPNHLFNETEFIGHFIAFGYRLIDEWETSLSCRIPLHREHSIDAYKGYYFANPGAARATPSQTICRWPAEGRAPPMRGAPAIRR